MFADLLPLHDATWRRFLGCARHDTYHLPEYVRVASRHEGGAPVAFYAQQGGDALLLPLLMREPPTYLGAPSDWCDVISPYGYPGPIATPNASPEFLRSAIAAFRRVAREYGIVSAFVRMHPLRSVPIDLLEGLGDVVLHGSVVYVDLAQTEEQWWAETRNDHQRSITRLVRLGYSVEMDDWTAYPTFRAVYRSTMERHSASAFYFFSDEYFSELHELLGDHVHLCIVRSPDGDVAAGGLFLLADGIVEYHLGGTAEAHLAKGPSKLMFDFVRRWAKAAGASVLNLGGGVGGATDSLYWFKSGFSRLSAAFHTVRIVFDEERYHRLSAASRVLHPPEDAHTTFFPAYRLPLPRGVAAVRQPA